VVDLKYRCEVCGKELEQRDTYSWENKKRCLIVCYECITRLES